MANRYDLITFKPGRDGKDYGTRIGVAFPTKSGDGFSLIFSALPIPDKEGQVRVLMSPPRDRDDAPRQSSAPASGGRAMADLDDDIPY